MAALAVALACGRPADTGAAAAEVEAARNRLFSAISSHDPDSIRAAAASDLVLIEDGLVWNMDSLLNTVRWLRDEGLRIEYSFQDDRVGVESSMAWMTYRNRGILSGKSGDDTLSWVESALFREEEGAWKMILLHSTQVEPR